MTTATELKAQILNKAEEDGEFRARLIADPKAAISSEVGVALPDGFDVAVHEDSATTAHLVLPPLPKLSHAQPSKLLLTAIQGRLRDPRFSADLADRRPRLGLAQHKPDLFLRVLLPFHGKIPLLPSGPFCQNNHLQVGSIFLSQTKRRPAQCMEFTAFAC